MMPAWTYRSGQMQDILAAILKGLLMFGMWIKVNRGIKKNFNLQTEVVKPLLKWGRLGKIEG